jgi:hypothetical protein
MTLARLRPDDLAVDLGQRDRDGAQEQPGGHHAGGRRMVVECNDSVRPMIAP